MITDSKIKTTIERELGKAENIWKQVGSQFLLEKAKEFSNFSGPEPIESQIPGFPFLEDGKPKVADFIALVLDIRNSTNHLLQRISEREASASQLERVLYETTAINTLGGLIIKEYKGGVTEYLGDGFLALFKVEKEVDPKEVYDAYNAAKECFRITNAIINPILLDRYGLPALEIGIGLAYSKAILTIVGTGNNLHPKVIGECVYRATKLSCGTNELFVDKLLKNLWPKSDKGKLTFSSFFQEKIEAYRIITT